MGCVTQKTNSSRDASPQALTQGLASSREARAMDHIGRDGGRLGELAPPLTFHCRRRPTLGRPSCPSSLIGQHTPEMGDASRSSRAPLQALCPFCRLSALGRHVSEKCDSETQKRSQSTDTLSSDPHARHFPIGRRSTTAHPLCTSIAAACSPSSQSCRQSPSGPSASISSHSLSSSPSSNRPWSQHFAASSLGGCFDRDSAHL